MDGPEQTAASGPAVVPAGAGRGSAARGRFSPLARALEKAVSVEFRSALVEVLQTPLEVGFRDLEECTWADFLASVEERSCCLGLVRQVARASNGLTEAGESPGPEGGQSPSQEVAATPQAWLEISPQIAFPIIDRLLGGSGREWYVPSRALTAIELGLLRRVGELAARCLGPLCPPALAATEGGGDVAEGRCPSVLAKFTLSMGRQEGALRLCLPLTLVDRVSADPDQTDEAIRVRGLVADSSRPEQVPPRGRAEAEPPPRRGAATEPPGVSGPLELSVVVQDIYVTAEELAGLGEGDLLVTDATESGEVLVRIGGIPRFYARLGVSNGRKAIRITRRVGQEEGRRDA